MSFLVTNIASPDENLQVVKNEQTFTQGKQVINLYPGDATIVDSSSDALRAFETASKVSIVDYAGEGEMFVYMSAASSGGAASEAMVVTGLLATDKILSIDQAIAGANDVAYTEFSGQVDDGLNIAWTGDPGAGAIMKITVLKA